jgi:chemotaxis protein histidine kinase CheA
VRTLVESFELSESVRAPEHALGAEADEIEEADELDTVEEQEEPLAPAIEAPALAVDVAPFSAIPPAPSWEQPGLFEEPTVDAYGTPLELVEQLRKSNGDAAVRLAADEQPATAMIDEPAPKPAFDDATPSLFDERLDRAPAMVAPVAPARDEIEEDSDELDDDEDGLFSIVETDEEDDADELEDAGEPAVEPRVVVDEAAEVDAEIEAEADEVEIVELAPQPPPAKASAKEPEPTPVPAAAAVRKKKREREPEIDDLVYRAGCLFIERQRVAVSMLQRDFGLDFKAATAVLDQLQKAGLIGPYLGGQRRDILISREQWDELVGVS